MRFDQPAGPNPIDAGRVVGRPTPRIDGPLKVSGLATYAHEQHDAAPDAAVGWVVGAPVARGRIRRLDTRAALAMPGVLAIVTHANAGPLRQGRRNTAPLLAGPEVAHYHQAVALVVAERFEQARDAAARLRVEIEPIPGEPGRFDLAAACEGARLPRAKSGEPPARSAVGDFARAFGRAAVRLDTRITTPDHSHAMMEPHASIAAWDDAGRLTVWTSSQMLAWGAQDLARTLGLRRDRVRLISPYVGGGFGGKLFLRADALLAALGARAAGRPVKVALQRPLIANNTTHRPATVQRIRIGCGNDGRIQAIAHQSWSGDQPGGGPETAVLQTRLLYAGAHRLTEMRLATLHLPEGNSMRAPGEAPGLMALEVAMDEMAERLGLDPVEFRLRNDTADDPEQPGRPFSQRRLAACLRTGAARFGWQGRPAKPGTLREGRWRIGLGMAAGIRNNLLVTSAARVRLDAAGGLTVETDMTDIGTGSYTILAQTAAEMLGLPLERVRVVLGDSSLPTSCGSGGQFGANNATSGVYAACVALREQIARRAGLGPVEGLRFDAGQVSSADGTVALADLAAAAGPEGLVAEDGIEHGDLDKRYQQSTFVAHFVEVAVDEVSCEVRVRRMLAVCAAGRILNPTTARSQVIGAMTMGVGAALMEHLQVDRRAGCFINHDLAGYEVPVHADIGTQQVVFLDEPDPVSSPMKAMGVGELGLCGVAAAVANAVYHATGVRVRDYPVTLDKLLAQVPMAA